MASCLLVGIHSTRASRPDIVTARELDSRQSHWWDLSVSELAHACLAYDNGTEIQQFLNGEGIPGLDAMEFTVR